MRRTSHLLLLTLPFLMVAGSFGCSGFSRRGEERRAMDAERVDTYVQELGEEGLEPLDTATVEINEPPPIIAPIPEEEEILPEETASPPESASIETEYVSGYRVQLYATGDPEKAKKFAESARSLFSEAKVYVEYLEPYYKVRVGDCLTREEAGLLLEKAKDLGFEEAWIAATLVIQGSGTRP